MAKKSAFHIVTANHLLEGNSIFLGDGGWTTDHRTARIASGADEAALLEALGQADEVTNKVVGVYLVAVEVGEDGRPEPIHYREKMRVRARPSFWTDSVSAPSVPIRHSGAAGEQHVSL